MKTILILEDNPQRVRWLERMVQGRADVLWTDTVQDFLATVEADPDLILLDHDLGTYFDGRTAARALEYDGPVIVWSANHKRGPQMVDILWERGLDVLPVWLPFGSPELPFIIRSTLKHGRLPEVDVV